MRDGVVLVVMALCAGHGQSEPGGGSGIDAVEKNDEALFFCNCTTFTVEQVIAVKAAGNFLVGGCIREEVTGELPDGELIEREVFVECTNDPVSP